ncbi:ABC transporter substrate-binding protein [Cohnella herbarum]|uniref:Iron-siderophore ABC transporter substrate-binding protein n=1 Tax=Cohnella herbarum TaxID=2728023 RepID=A0A7Z2ZKH4_9BACL|nr:iron-siderophore ABC transporter substrate-binding protein [Cohnella herbarum]QJD82973.1 iron-siderophore ABC transporter substrate-binding protein [Cohnella herbarum]
MLGSQMGIHRKSWIYLSVLVLLLTVLAGCGNSESDTTNGNTSGSATPASTETAANATDNQANTAATRVVKDAYEEVEVPENPERIVVLDIGALDNLLELGIKPIGAPSILTAGDPYPAYLKGTDGIDNIGTVNEPNMEAIDALKPDLIIGNKDAHEAIRDQLKQIAPTVFVESLGVTWKANLLLHAETVNKQEAGKKLLENYEQRIEELKSKLSANEPIEVSLFRPREDKIQIYLKGTFAGSIMTDAGITRPAAQSDEGFSKDLTTEQIADLDGDVMLWFNREESAFAKLESSALWATLEGAKNKRVHPVDWEYWMSGLGIQAVNKVVDDLNAYLVD